MKRSILVVLVALLPAVPTLAHAEFRADTRASSEIRPSRKTTNAPSRASFAKQERPAGERLSISTNSEIPAVLSVDAVLTKINTVYMAGLQRCYRKQLASDPTVAGKITLMFSVDAKGGVLADVRGISDKLDSCLSRAVGHWRFPHADEPAEATFKVSLVLSK
jgi:hypothetical protein